nr:Ref family recombination enhancement nuclease [Paenalcaligenes hominis]
MTAYNSTLKRGKPMKRTPFKKSALSKPMKINPKAKMSSKGMKGNSVSADQKRYHDALASLGCIACRLDGNHQPIVSVHHIDGRTKPHAHWLVLALCAGHHQDGTGAPGLIAVHPWKGRFEARYGNQLCLLQSCHSTLRSRGYDVPEAAVEALSNAGGVRL